MMRRVFRMLLHIVGSVLLLALIVCGAEVALRFCDAEPEDGMRFGGPVASLTVESQFTHHQLETVQTVAVDNADTGQSVTLTTNSYGIRGDEPAVPKPAGVIRILCLGDESVLAPETSGPDLFTKSLQQMLQRHWRRPVEVINAGVPGYCPLLSYLQLKHSLLVLQPDLVILNFDMSDVADDYQFRRHTIVDETGTPMACSRKVEDNRMSAKSKLVDDFCIGRWCKRKLRDTWLSSESENTPTDIADFESRFAWISNNPPDWSIYIRQTLSVFDQLKSLCAAIQSELIVATYPAPWQVSASASSGPGVRESAGVAVDAYYSSTAPFQILDQYCANHRITFVDASPTFRNSADSDSLFLKSAPRFSTAGHAVYAHVLAEFVAARFALPENYERQYAERPDRTANR